MLSDQLLSYVLIAALVNTAIFIFTSYILFVRYGLPIYHIMGLYQLYHFLGFVLRPWEMYFRESASTWSYIGASPSGATILWATAVLAVAQLSMIAGFLMINPRFGPVAALRPMNFRVGRPAMFAVCVAVFIGLGLYGSYTQFGSVLEINSFGKEMILDAQGGYRNVEVSGYQTMFAELLPVTLLTLFAVRRTRGLGIVMVVAFIGYRLLAGGGRSAFIAIVLALIFMSLINIRRRLPTAVMIVGSAVLLLAFNIIGADRNSVRHLVNGDSSVGEILSNYVSSENMDGVTQNMGEFDVFTSILDHVPYETGYTYGTQYLRLLIWPIPRSVWADKPVFTSIVNMLDYGNFQVLTYTLYGDSYMTLGIVGMILILFLISLYINWLYRLVSQRPTALNGIIYFIHLMYATILFRDGPVSAAYFYITLGLGALILVRVGALYREQE